MVKKISALSVVLLVVTGCWDKQNNQVLAPEPALYPFSGSVVDLADGALLSDIHIIMEEIELSETSLDSSISFGIKTTVSDEEGRFQFDSVYVGRYRFTFVRNDYVVESKNYLQSYTARDEVYELPRAFTDGYTWTRDTNSLISFYTGDSLALSMSLEDQRIVFYKQMNTAWTYSHQFTNPVPNSFDAEFGRSEEEVWIISNDQGSQRVYRLMFSTDSGWQASVLVPDEPAEMLPVALTAGSDTVLVSTSADLYHFSADRFELLREIAVPDGVIITSLDRYGDRLWLFDKNRQYLYECTADLLIDGIYVVYLKGERPRIADFGIDFSGRFWFVKTQ